MNDIKEKYTCDACRYTFESDKLPDRCPDCGKLQVRRASESEITDIFISSVSLTVEIDSIEDNSLHEHF